MSEPVVDVLGGQWRAIAALGDQLAPDEWDLPSECPGWAVRDLVSHMVGTERSLLGEHPPPDPGPVAHVHNPVGAVNEAWVSPRRSLPGSEVLTEFKEVTAQRLEQLAAMAPESFEEPSPSPIGVVPYREFMAVRVMDCWVHEQDMRVATGRSGRYEGPAAALALDRLASAMGYVVAKKASAPEGSSVRFALAGTPSRRIDVVVRQGRGLVEPVDVPSAVLDMDVELFWRLGCGRVPGDAALRSRLVRVGGDSELGAQVARNMAFMI